MTEELPQKDKEPKLEMTSYTVVNLFTELENLGIKIWIDGGWGVDALLGEQSRFHKDLDIAIQEKDVPSLRVFLEKQGYRQIREDNKWNFVLGDHNGHEVDVHSFIFDDKGNVVEGITYPAEALVGTGTINGQTVRCLSAEDFVKRNRDYELQDKDFQDVRAICDKFQMELPEKYARKSGM